MTGLAVVSLSIAYVLPVVRGVVDKRSLALYISTLGATPAEIITNAWDGDGLGQLDLHFIALTPQVASVAQSHLAYPVIHYFHSADPETALGPSIAVLDAALTASRALDPSIHIDRNAVEPLRAAVGRFLRTLELAFIHPGDVPEELDNAPQQQTVTALETAGIPLGELERLRLTEQDVDRNRLLRGYLVHDGWEHLEGCVTLGAA